MKSPMIRFEVRVCNNGLAVTTRVNGQTIAIDHFPNSNEVDKNKTALLARTERLIADAVTAQNILNEVNSRE